MKNFCPKCIKETSESVNFCPHCGREFKPAGKVLISAQKRKIYLLSFFLSPLGLVWFFKHFRSEESENRKTAYIALIITFVPLVLTLFIGKSLIGSLTETMELYETELNIFEFSF